MTKATRKCKTKSVEEQQNDSMDKPSPRTLSKRTKRNAEIKEDGREKIGDNPTNQNRNEDNSTKGNNSENSINEDDKNTEKCPVNECEKGDNCISDKDLIIEESKNRNKCTPIKEIIEIQIGSQEKLTAGKPNKKEVTKKSNRKRKPITHKTTDSVMDLFNKTITICIEEEDTDDEMGKQPTQTQDQVKDTSVTDKRLGTKNSDKGESIEKGDKSQNEQTVSVITLSEDSNDVSVEKDTTESVTEKVSVKTCGNQTEFEDKEDSRDDIDDSIESITPTIQSDPVLEKAIPVCHQNHTSQILSSDKEKNLNGFHQREVIPHDEDAMAAARLMTDMAASKITPYASHSNTAETHVTNSGYGYCSSTDHEDLNTNYNRQVPPFPENYTGQIYGQNNWHPMMFGQPADPYWEGNFQNVAMYDCNNNIVNQGHSLYQNSENANFGNMGMAVRMSGSGTSQQRMQFEFENEDARMPLDFRQFHPMPMDYSLPNTPGGIPGQNTPFREVGNVPNERRQVSKIVLLDPKSAKRGIEDNTGSPSKRQKRSRSSQMSTESVADYDEIVKNLFVNAPPTKTILIQPKFMAKENGSHTSDIDTTQVRSISHRGIISKYIDYLLMENEYITEISKAVSLPMENCVMDDPYLMDVIRIKIPFPTPKYMQFLKDFYPAIQVDWRALNHQLDQYRSGGDGAERFHTYYLDNRAVPVLLGEAFYFFQRESDRKVMEKTKSS